MKFILLLLLTSFMTVAQERRNYGSQEIPAPFLSDSKSFGSDSIDWRNVAGVNWVGPVRNQANCGSCVAFAAIATVEDQFAIHTGNFWNRHNFSQEALFSCGKGGCSDGWLCASAAQYLRKNGVVDVSCAPYTAGQLGKVRECKTFCDSQLQRTIPISNVIRPTIMGAGEPEDVKRALKRGPVLTSMAVYPGFDSYKGGIFKATDEIRSLGGHAVEIVGFNDAGRYWIIKNSWGEDWGEKGFARISYDDASGIGNDTYGFEFDFKMPEAFFTPEEDAYVRGVLKIEGRFSSNVSLKKTSGELISDFSCKNDCEISTSSLSDGAYRLETMTTSGVLITRGFVVVNKDYEWSSTVAPPKGFDFRNTQFGRFYIDAKYPVSDVYPEKLILDILDLKGVLLYRRVFTDVLDFNRMGVNSYIFKNGPYKLVLKEHMLGREKKIGEFNIQLKN